MDITSKAEAPVQAAVIGLGNIGLLYDIPLKAQPQSHSLAYHLHPKIDLVAAVGVRQEQGDTLALVAPRTEFYLDLVAMLRNHRLDIISICTPSDVRFDLLKTVLENSSARVIFLEKPVATSIHEAEKIAALAQSYNRTLLVNLSRRWSDGVVQIREAVRTEQYGKLKKIHLRYTRGIFNYGSHLFDLVRFVSGSIDQVRVIEQVPTNLDAREDWTYSFLFSLASGGIAGYAEAFDDRDFLIFEMDLYFEQGKIEMLNSGDKIRYYATEAHPMLAGIKSLVLEHQEDNLLHQSSNIQNAVDHLVDVLTKGAKPISTLEDGIYPLYVAEALMKSHRNNGSVEKVRNNKNSGDGRAL
ncbi:Gfo/Idh/MocA family protein [Paenibacillus agricola]|uniref:Gfo/Idh/MocA family oxidoreductase n=1 Tax=Paenibacillus agricola TaxID=2716264 RepID=A0ABX0J9E7_9BACL|nr:Gfo/Idh/MocA family oxidoreductase [Paenibacillus agricola]NHN32762.1 Gfo/Idh/MocA family oxidoreductase [Paenibacillus agricola]